MEFQSIFFSVICTCTSQFWQWFWQLTLALDLIVKIARCFHSSYRKNLWNAKMHLKFSTSMVVRHAGIFFKAATLGGKKSHLNRPHSRRQHWEVCSSYFKTVIMKTSGNFKNILLKKKNNCVSTIPYPYRSIVHLGQIWDYYYLLLLLF